MEKYLPQTFFHASNRRVRLEPYQAIAWPHRMHRLACTPPLACTLQLRDDGGIADQLYTPHHINALSSSHLKLGSACTMHACMRHACTHPMHAHLACTPCILHRCVMTRALWSLPPSAARFLCPRTSRAGLGLPTLASTTPTANPHRQRLQSASRGIQDWRVRPIGQRPDEWAKGRPIRLLPPCCQLEPLHAPASLVRRFCGLCPQARGVWTDTFHRFPLLELCLLHAAGR